jgi:predicted PilT family ATPase
MIKIVKTTFKQAFSHSIYNKKKVVKVTHKPTDLSVLVRAYGKGSERIIDRKQEIVVMFSSKLWLIYKSRY